MLKFKRNKLVTIKRVTPDIWMAHGILDDDIYSIELDVSIRISTLTITAICGKWNRWTTPECPRSLDFLKEAIGLQLEDKTFSQKVQKSVSRKACRHFANLLLECCYTSREAARADGCEIETVPDNNSTVEVVSDEKIVPASNPDPVKITVDKSRSETKIQEQYENSNINSSGDLIIDLHVHTSPASPCSSAPVDDLIEEARRIGLDGICLTDHNYTWHPDQIEELRQKHSFLVLGGNEITTDQGDVLVFGLNENVQGIIKLAELRKKVLADEGFMVIAHPFRGFLTFDVGELGFTPEKAMKRPLFKWVDAVETLNGKVTAKENAFAAKVAQGLGLPTTGGSDAHEVSEVGFYATRFTHPIKDERDLIEAFRNKAFSPVLYKKERRKIENSA